MVLRFERFPVATPSFHSIFDFEQNIDEMFGNFIGTGLSVRHRDYPALDVAEHENNSVVVAELPGVLKEDLKVSVQENVLTISGERKGVSLPEKSGWIRNEISSGKFSRTIELPHAVNTAEISAELKNGVLRITLPKAEQARTREIQVK